MLRAVAGFDICGLLDDSLYMQCSRPVPGTHCDPAVEICLLSYTLDLLWLYSIIRQ